MCISQKLDEAKHLYDLACDEADNAEDEKEKS